MATERRRQLLLGGLVVALVAVIVWLWPSTSAAQGEEESWLKFS